MSDFALYSKVALAAFFRWIMLSGAGVVLSVIGLTVGLALLKNHDGGTHLGAIFSVFVLFADEPWTGILIAVSIAFIAIYIIVASKFSISFVLHCLFENKLLPVIGTKVASTLRSFSEKQGRGLPPFANADELQKKLANLINQDSDTNKIQRKAIHYGRKKIDLHDVDFTQKDLNVPDVVADRLMRRLTDAAKPSYQVFGIVFTVHLFVLVLALVFDHH